VIAITAFGGNLFGLIAPIITGYVVAGTGGYTWAFRIAAALLLCGAVITLLMTRKVIESQHGKNDNYGSFGTNKIPMELT
jgi:ACS family glucarate transporter-like MFS transporter